MTQQLVALLGADKPDRVAITALLDGMDHGQRVQAIRALSGNAIQERLWKAVADAPRCQVGDLIPADTRPLHPVTFEGKNSLLAFTQFQKRFCRPADRAGELWGYNHTNIGWLVGPGYFVVHDDPLGAAIDYRAVPPTAPAGWPAIRPNDQGLSRFVYNNMVDYMRRVSRDVFIGAAYKGGKPFGSYFVLCREPEGGA